MYLNLLIVFFLTGFWHGASWSFVAWGLFHGFFMILERLGLENLLKKIPQQFANLYTILVVMFAWVLFRSDTLNLAIHYWRALFNFQLTTEQFILFLDQIHIELFLAAIIAIPGALGLYTYIGRSIEPYLKSEQTAAKVFSYSYHTGSVFFYAVILVACSMYLIAGTYNPFIYYRF